MKRVMNIVTSNWFLFSIGLLLTAKCVELAYQKRGYIAFGGEWLVFPMMIVVKAFAEDVKREMERDD